MKCPNCGAYISPYKVLSRTEKWGKTRCRACSANLRINGLIAFILVPQLVTPLFLAVSLQLFCCELWPLMAAIALEQIALGYAAFKLFVRLQTMELADK